MMRGWKDGMAGDAMARDFDMVGGKCCELNAILAEQ